MPAMLQGLIQLLFVTISMSTRPSLPRSSHPGAHQKSTLMRLGTRWWSLSAQGLSKRFFTPNSGQHRGSQEEKWKMAGLCRLHGPKQSLPKRPVSHASDKPADGCDSGPSSDEFLRCLSGLSSNTTSPGGSGEDSLHDTYWELPLQGNAVQFEERRVHLSKDDDKNVWAAVGQQHQKLYSSI